MRIARIAHAYAAHRAVCMRVVVTIRRAARGVLVVGGVATAGLPAPRPLPGWYVSAARPLTPARPRPLARARPWPLGMVPRVAAAGWRHLAVQPCLVGGGDLTQGRRHAAATAARAVRAAGRLQLHRMPVRPRAVRAMGAGRVRCRRAHRLAAVVVAVLHARAAGAAALRPRTESRRCRDRTRSPRRLARRRAHRMRCGARVGRAHGGGGDEAIEWMPCGVAEHGRGRLPTALRGGVVCSVGKMSPADSIDLCRFGALSSIRSVSLSIAHVTLGRVLAPAVVGR